MTKTFDLDSLIRANIRVLTPYRCARDDHDRGILLDANENSIGSVPDDPRALNRYPDPHQNELREAFARFRGIRAGQIFCGVGSDEAIDLIIRIFCEPARSRILITPPTYGMYKVSAAINDVQVDQVPLSPDFQLRVPETLAAIRPETRVIFLCSPNNPTGNLLRKEDIRSLMQAFHGIVVVDEAYIDFSAEDGFAGELDHWPNLIVMQTFSKSFGLAGIRIGVALASEAIIGYMLRVKAPYNINKLTAEVALEALKHTDQMNGHIRLLLEERERVSEALKKLPSVREVFPSDANFLLASVDNALNVYKTMADAGVVIRYRGDQVHCGDTVRITIGTAEENDKMLAMLGEVTS